jgi:hypothetical protein
VVAGVSLVTVVVAVAGAVVLEGVGRWWEPRWWLWRGAPACRSRIR